MKAKINNAVKTTSSSAKLSPPIAKPSRTGLTISGGKISTYTGGESGPKTTSNIYKDPNTGSTIATKEARTNVAEGKDYNIVASTASKTLLGKGVPTPTTKERPGLTGTSPTGMKFIPTAPKISAGDIIGQKPKPKTAGPKGFTKKTPTPFMEKQIDIVNNLTNPEATKTDLLTGQPIEKQPTLKVPTLLSEIRKKRSKRNLGGGQFMTSLIRTLLG